MLDQVFRHQHGRRVALLVRRVGFEHLPLVEDAVQSAMERALSVWTDGARPDDAAAWLYRVAYHQLLQDVRRASGRARLLEASGDPAPGADAPPPSFPGEVQDELLRMLFVCCDPGLPPDSRLVLARQAARVDATGGLVLLEEQDRTRWDRTRIERGAEWLARSAQGATFSRTWRPSTATGRWRRRRQRRSGPHCDAVWPRLQRWAEPVGSRMLDVAVPGPHRSAYTRRSQQNALRNRSLQAEPPPARRRCSVAPAGSGYPLRGRLPSVDFHLLFGRAGTGDSSARATTYGMVHRSEKWTRIHRRILRASPLPQPARAG